MRFWSKMVTTKCGIVLLLPALVALTGCVSNVVVQANSKPAEKVEGVIPDDQLLDIGIGVFNPGIPEEQSKLKKHGIIPAIRDAEAKLLPYNLRVTLEETGNWGVVRVIPKKTEAVDLYITGGIQISDGELLKLHVEAFDATGRRWLSEDYDDQASRFAYDPRHPVKEDPFQDIYNRVADDLLELRRSLSQADVREIRRVSTMRFAADLAPVAFADYIEHDQKKDRYAITRLAAEDDQMLARVDKIREREYMFIDLLDDHYASFRDTLSQAYGDWRRYSYDEMIELRRLQKSAGQRMLMAAAVVGTSVAVSTEATSNTSSQAANAGILTGLVVAQDALRMGKRANAQAEAVRELGESFASEAAPLVFDLEGQTVTLAGTAESQFDEWRHLLREIYEAETGFGDAEADERPGTL